LATAHALNRLRWVVDHPVRRETTSFAVLVVVAVSVAVHLNVIAPVAVGVRRRELTRFGVWVGREVSGTFS
jgi:hypothetical protein